jgi:hypothetical protein
MTDCVDELVQHLPSELKNKAQALSSETFQLLDTLLRFALGSECPAATSVSDDTRQCWSTQQQVYLSQAQGSRAEKRSREEPGGDSTSGEGKEEGEQSSKRRKLDDIDSDDTHLFTLNSLSVSSPIRKKLDVAVYKKTLRLSNPSTHAVELSVALADVKRAFLIPTRGKAKPHWSVVLLCSDTPVTTKGKDASKSSASSDQVQVVFGVDVLPLAAYTTSEGTHSKGTPTAGSLHTFLSHLPPHVSVVQLALEQEQSQVVGVQAYRRAKEGTLWFIRGGVLWDGKPAEFWDVSDLVGDVPGGEEGDVDGATITGAEGVRVVSATGRTCSVFLRRRLPSKDNDEEGAIQVEETDFAMIDGKEQDAILQWVKRSKKQFGKAKQQSSEVTASAGGQDIKGKGKAVDQQADEDTDDEDDEDFVASSDTDGSASSASSNSEDDENADASDHEDEDAEGSGSGEEEELDPAQHPLLRPGAMPKMSKAAIEAAVSMVTNDLLSNKSAMDVDEDEDAEVDELDD